MEQKQEGCWTANNPSYINSLDAAVEEYKKRFPDRYEKAQRIGEMIMEREHEHWKVGCDQTGDVIRATNLLMLMREYHLSVDDLSPEEHRLLSETFGSTWMTRLLSSNE